MWGLALPMLHFSQCLGLLIEPAWDCCEASTGSYLQRV